MQYMSWAWISKVWEAEKHLLILKSALDIFKMYSIIFFSNYFKK